MIALESGDVLQRILNKPLDLRVAQHRLASAMLKGGWVNELRVHYASTLIGAGRGIAGTFDKEVWKLHAVESLQNDVLITYVAASL